MLNEMVFREGWMSSVFDIFDATVYRIFRRSTYSHRWSRSTRDTCARKTSLRLNSWTRASKSFHDSNIRILTVLVPYLIKNAKEIFVVLMPFTFVSKKNLFSYSDIIMDSKSIMIIIWTLFNTKTNKKLVWCVRATSPTAS